MKIFNKEYISYSSIKNILESPQKFKLYMEGKLERKSQAFDFGSAYDAMLFEPETFSSKYVFIDDKQKIEELVAEGSKSPRATSKYKEWYADQTKGLSEDAVILTEDDHTKLMFMYDAISQSGVLDTFLTGEYQGTLIGVIDGITVLIKYDCLNDDGEWITDLKTTDNLVGFKWDVNKYHYDLQGYLYERLTDRKFRWVVQEKNTPNTCAVYEMSDYTRGKAEEKWNIAKQRLNEYFLSNDAKPTQQFFIYGEI